MPIFQIGPQAVALTGDGPLRSLVADEFSAVALPDDVDVAMRIHFGPVPPVHPDAVTVGEVSALDQSVWMDFADHGWRVHGTVSPDNVPVLTVEDRLEPRRSPDFWQRLNSWTFQTDRELYAYLWIHNILEAFLLIASSRVGLLHAAAVSIDGRAVALTSTGGVGKTSTAVELLRRYGYGFLSDDITPIDADGNAYLYPRKMMVYPYNLQGSGLNIRQIASRGTMDRAAWSLLARMRGLKGVRRRVAAADLFSIGPATQPVPLAASIYLRRKATPGFVVAPLSATSLADRCAAVQVTEFPQTWEMLHYWKATGHCPRRPDAVSARQEQIFAAAFAASGTSSTWEILVPPESTPRDLAARVDEIVRDA